MLPSLFTYLFQKQRKCQPHIFKMDWVSGYFHHEVSEQRLIQKVHYYYFYRGLCIFAHAVYSLMHQVLWVCKSGFCCESPPSPLHGIKVQDPKSCVLVKWKLRHPISPGCHSVQHHQVTSQATDPPAQKNLHHPLWKLKFFFRCKALPVFYLLTVHHSWIYFYSIFFLWYIISTHLTGECTQGLRKSCFKTIW